MFSSSWVVVYEMGGEPWTRISPVVYRRDGWTVTGCARYLREFNTPILILVYLIISTSPLPTIINNSTSFTPNTIYSQWLLATRVPHPLHQYTVEPLAGALYLAYTSFRSGRQRIGMRSQKRERAKQGRQALAAPAGQWDSGTDAQKRVAALP